MSEKPIIINIPPADTWPITALRHCCKKNKVKGYTKMDRNQLIDAVKSVIASYKNIGE